MASTEQLARIKKATAQGYSRDEIANYETDLTFDVSAAEIRKRGYSTDEMFAALGIAPPSRGIFDTIKDLGVAGLEGTKSMARSVGAAGNTVSGDLSDVEGYAAAQKAAAANSPEAKRRLMADIAAKKQANPDPSLWQGIKDVFGSAADNPEGTAQFVVEQAPNTAVSLGAGVIGGKAGLVAGTAIAPLLGPFAPLGPVVGGAVGFLGGMFLGSSTLEIGGKAIEKAEGGFTKVERGEAITEGLKKGGVITAVDAATLGAGGLLIKSFGKAAIGAGARAEARILADAGVDITSREAIEIALVDPALREIAKAAGKEAAKQASTVGSKAAMAGTGITLETAGEGAGEYFGELAATGKADVHDAVMESLAGLTQSAPEVAWNMSRASGNDLDSRGIVRAGGLLSRNVETSILGAQTATDAISAFEAAGDSISTPIQQTQTASGLFDTSESKDDIASLLDEINRSQTIAPQKPGEMTRDDFIDYWERDGREFAEAPPVAPALSPTELTDISQAAQITPPAIEAPLNIPIQPGVQNAQATPPATAPQSPGSEAKEAVLAPALTQPAIGATVTPGSPVDALPASQAAGGALVASLQNRNRNSKASILQMNAIASNPNPRLLMSSPTMETGAPAVTDLAGNGIARNLGNEDVITTGSREIPFRYAVVEADQLSSSNFADGTKNPEYAANTDKLTAINNGRTAGVIEAYNRGTAQAYRDALAANQATHGIGSDVIQSMSRPVLVRLIDSKHVTDNIADESNTSSTLGLSAIEHARNDVRRVDVSAFTFNEDGTPTNSALRGFVRAMPKEEWQTLSPDGLPTQQAADRLLGAALYQAYGSDELVDLAMQSNEQEARTIIGALSNAAPAMMKLEGAGDLDIRPIIIEAVTAVVNATRNGMPIKRLVQQRDMSHSDGVQVILNMFAENARSKKAITEKLIDAATYAANEAEHLAAGDMFGGAQATKQDVLRRIGNDTARQEDMGQQVGAGAIAADAQRPTQDGAGQDTSQGAQGQEEGSSLAGKAPAEQGGPRQGSVGMMLESGEVVITLSGRQTTPFPAVKTDTSRKATATVKAVNGWLMRNALEEARSRGDSFNARQFEAAIDRPQQADKDSAEEYLFGQQPDVVRSSLKPLVGKSDAARPDLSLTQQTERDLLDRETEINKREAAQNKREREALDKEKADRERDDIKRRSEAAAETFTLGGDAETNLSGQGDIFGQPAEAPFIKKGDQFTDGQGNTWEVWNARSSLIEAFPVVGGKMRVNNQDGQLWATDERARSANPEARTDFTLVPPKKKVVTPQLMTDGQFTSVVKIAADSIEALRKQDVERVLAETPAPFKLDMADRIKAARPDLVEEVDDLMNEALPSKLDAAAESIDTALDAALKELADALKKQGSQLNTGIDPAILALGVKVGSLYVAKGVVKFAQYSKAIIDALRALGVDPNQIKPHLKQLYAATKQSVDDATFERMDDDRTVRGFDLDSIEAAAPTADNDKADSGRDSVTLSASLAEAIRRGDMPKHNLALKKLVEDFDGKAPDQARMKQAQEQLELAIVMVSREVVAKNDGDATTYEALKRLYNSQPNLNIRTSTSIANQAYSTPAPLAFLASRLAGITSKSVVHEPTGGTGMLLIGANPDIAIVNELNDLRVSLLKEQGFTPTQKDAATQTLADPGQVDTVIANPPFGSVKDANDKPVKVKVDGYDIGQIDHLIVARALTTMKDEGSATLILGANKVTGGLSTDDRIFFNWLYGNYNVVGHFEVDGDLYARQGAGWPVRVITIKGRAKTNTFSPVAGTIERARTWDQVYEQYQKVLATIGKPDRSTSGSVIRAGDGKARPVPVQVQNGAAPSGTDRLGARGSKDGDGNVAGTPTGVVPDRADKPTKRVGDGADEQRLNAQSDSPSGLEPAGKTDKRPSDRKPAGTAGSPAVVGSDENNQFQVKYIARSARKDDGVLIPTNMAQPTQDALSALEDAVGDIDEFARVELGYETMEDLHAALMGLQVDSVAMAIHQIKQNKAVVIADQTGIGKGRQAAAIIRWAAKQGYTPIFISVKPSLFTDMYGDLADIGTDDIRPFVMNSKAWVAGSGGDKLFSNKASTHRANLNRIESSGNLPGDSNAVFMTYSQINKNNVQRSVLMTLAPNAVFVLDESHNAAGESATGEFVIGALGLARGVTYLSATYAKRPDNMPLYFKTDIGDAAADTTGLAAAMAAGGLPLQTVVSNNLVKAGQMFRRERSYDGVEIKSVFDTGNRAKHEAMSNEATTALRAIVEADKSFHEIFVKSLSKELAEQGSAIKDIAGNQVQAGVQHTEFSSVVHNFVKQMLLGLKAQTAADEAIAALKRNEKPIIAVENTMGSFLVEYAAANGIVQGGSLGGFDYRTVMSRALARSRVIVVTDAMGNETKRTVSLAELDSFTRQAYTRAQEVIDGLKLDIPASPIDWMRARIISAGYQVAEITGRKMSVDYSDPKNPTLSAIDHAEQSDKVNTTRKFNDGRLDALILNVAGSTGISLHSSGRFVDQRQRHMIVAQAAGDINVFMQMLGRIHRTGQVNLPKYTLLSVDLPTEKRPTAVLSIKMKSLNANTSSNTESATSVKTADILNKYGDQIVNQYLFDNHHLAIALGVDDLITLDQDNVADDLARMATGRLALQPIDVQHTFYDEVENQYGTLIDYLNKTNQNDLEPRTFDFDAKETSQEILFDGPNKSTPFGEDAIYGEYSIKAQGEPMSPAEISAEMAEHLGGKESAAHVNALIDDLLTTWTAQVNADRAKHGLVPGAFDADKYGAFWTNIYGKDAGADAVANAVKRIASGQDIDDVTSADMSRSIGTAESMEFMRDHAIGKMFRIDINGDQYNAIVTNIRSTHKETGSPFSLSKVQLTVAVNGSLRSLSIPGTQFKRVVVSGIYGGYRMEQLFKEQPPNQRETAKIVTGNLLAAYGEISGARGTIISFTKNDGSTEQGILLPKQFEFKQNTRGDYRLPDAESAMRFLQTSNDVDIARFGIASRDGNVRVLPSGRGVIIKVPKSKAKGGKFFMDKDLIAATGDFVSSGSFMVATVHNPDDATAALAMVIKKKALYAMPSMSDEARAISAPRDIAFSRAEPFATRKEATIASIKERGTVVVSDDNGGWLLAPRVRPYNDQERQDAQQRVTKLNQALLRAGVARAQVLRDAPTGSMVLGSRIANVLGFQVTFIERNRDFDGVSLGGQAFVSPGTGHPEIGLIGHEVTHSLERTDPEAYQSLADHIRGYLKDGVVEAKRKWEDARGGKNTSTAKAESEILADLNGAMWLDPKFWREMAQNAPSLFRKVAYKFMEVATKAMTATSRFKADSLVTDVDAVRSIMVKAWTAQAQKANAKDAGDWAMPTSARAAPLTETQFYNSYAQHIDIRGRDGSVDGNKAAILRDGFGKSMNVNAMPVSRKLMNVIDRKYQPKAGDTVYLIPKSGWKDGPNGIKVNEGWKPEPHEVVTVTDPSRPMYEYYKDALDNVAFSRTTPSGPNSPQQPIPGTVVPQAQQATQRTSKQQPLGLPPGSTSAVPEETGVQAAQRTVQDKFNRFGVLQDWLKEQGVTLSEKADVVLAETLMSGRISTRKEDFRGNQMGPLIEKTQAAGVSMEQVGDYLKAQHAPEANVRARDLHGKPDATAYGMSDQDAKDAMDAFKALPNFSELKAIAGEWQAITAQSKKILLDAEILSDDQVAAWGALYSDYVPVKGMDDKPGSGTGKGMDVNGRQKRRMGHALRDEGIIENILRDHERAITLDEKNQVGHSLIRFALAAKNPDIITVGKPVKRQVLQKGQSSYIVTHKGMDVAAFDTSADASVYITQESLKGRTRSDFAVAKTTDPVRVMLQASPLLADNEVNVYVAGHAVRVQINDEIAARAYTNLGVEHLGAVLGAGRKFNNWLSKVYTGYSPDFIFTNPLRDATQGFVTLTGEYGAGTAAKIFTNYPMAVKELAKNFIKSGSSAIVTDYRASGGSTGAAYLSDLERIGDDIQAAYNEHAGVMDTYQRTYDKAIADGKSATKANALATLKSGLAGAHRIPLIGHVLKLMERINAVTENALRVATYYTLVQDGVSKPRAAAQAKNLMNFNRKGEIANQAGALYLFFNPSVQGAQVMHRALFESKHKNQARALAGTMVLAAIVLAEMAMMGGEDDEDKWNNTPDHVKDGYMVFKFGDYQLTLTLPYGYRVFHVLGNVISDYAHGTKDGYQLGIRFASNVFANFSPFGNPMSGDNFPFQVLPTAAKMALGPSINENSFGQAIGPQRYSEAKPDSQMLYRATKGTVYSSVAEGLNAMSGGSKYERGVIDVSPETLNFWVKSLTGGAGQFAIDTISIGKMGIQGVLPQSPKSIPIIRRFVREVGISDTRAAFWDRAKEANNAADEFAAARRSGDRGAMADIRSEKGPLITLSKYADRQQKMIKAMRDETDRIKNDDSLTLKQQIAQMKLVEMREAAVYSRFIKAFDEGTESKAEN